MTHPVHSKSTAKSLVFCWLGLALLSGSPSAHAQPQSGFLSGDPRDDLPAHIRQLTWFGERPEWRPDGRRFAFLSRIFGDAFEYDLETGRIIPLTVHFSHYGFVRVSYLANGDFLLAGPGANFDEKVRESRLHARHTAELFVLDRSLTKPAVALGAIAEEGQAVSRTRLRVAWTENRQDRLRIGDIVYEDGVPKLANVRTFFTPSSYPTPHKGFETQNFVPPEERYVTAAGYILNNTPNTDTFVIDTETGDYRNVTQSPDTYDEPEGIFPDGKSTLVEHAPSRGSNWPLIDLFQVSLDGSGSLRRLTHFSDYRGWKASQGVVSEDGKWMLFQIGRDGDEAGRGYGVFLCDLSRAE